MVPIIEEAAIPLLMPTLGTFMEVQMVRSVEHVESIQSVFGSVAMDNIKQDDYSHAMSSVDELLELFRGSKPAASSEEAIYLIAKACIIRMLHDCH